MISTFRISAMAKNKLVVKSNAGSVLSIFGYNAGPDQFIQLHDSAGVPDEGAVPVATMAVFGQSNFGFDIPVAGFPFSLGLTVCNSSTANTKTLGAEDCSFTAVILA